MGDPYDFLYLLKPIKEVEPGWWKLRWRPIWRQTISIYWSRYRNDIGFGFRTWRSDAKNGWNRSYKHWYIEITFFFWTFTGWVRWDAIVHRDGPSDVSERRPLNLT